ncbi:MFS transporter [Xylophilus sp. GOD-11R]|uniref:MFS transporter n=1 Tax=Xylophilus sp. GOD-11R TaxID=3089814 RepID=UPI00298C9E97|nr:MFS transporter [Xylophilus sp. GOD-11R]WPB58037.1 MFS transporter [Xylophilus sp. GOD-11R]
MNRLTDTSTSSRLAAWATRISFFIAGFGTSAWAPLVPFARDRIGLDDGGLGLLLLALGTGSLLAMPIAGALAARFGCRRVMVPASLAMCAALQALATADSAPMLGAALLLFGAAVGSLDCAANIHAVIVERCAGRPMMSGFHGLYSVGGIAGAGGVSGLLLLGATPLLSTLLAAGVVLVALAAVARHFLAAGAQKPQAFFALPRGPVLLIGVLCFIVFLTEGAMLDWSAVLLVGAHGVGHSTAGLAYASFSAAMTIGRLCGDRVVTRVGVQSVILYGALCAAGGLILATMASAWQSAMLGYFLVGAGCSNIVPVLYTAAGRQTHMPESLAVPAISTLGYAGILAGPALIGLAARGVGLSSAFLGVAVLLIGVAAAGRLFISSTNQARD